MRRLRQTTRRSTKTQHARTIALVPLHEGVDCRALGANLKRAFGEMGFKAGVLMQGDARNEGDWYARLREELSRCKSAGNFVTRTFCEEKSKILLCGVGNHWGQVPECLQTNTRRPDSN